MAQELIDKIRAAAQASNVDPDVAVRIAQVESSLNPAAQAKTSSAKGLFQVIDSTWKQYGGKPGKQTNADENIRVGVNILADNTNRLRSALGRDPSASELYAAHFFGAGAAPAVLSASPDTPISELLSQRAVKANPQLQGKTAGEVRQMLQAKMGQAPVQPKAAPSDGREGQPDFEAIGRGQMTADLGSGYKAALALSFLGDEEESQERKLDEQERQAARELADYKSFNALNELEFGPTKVPLLTAQAPAAPQGPVQQLAGGGLVGGPVGDPNAYNRWVVDQFRAGAFAPQAAVPQAAANRRFRIFGRGRQLPAAPAGATGPAEVPMDYNIQLADGGEVEGTAAQMLKQVVPMDIRTFGSTLFGSREPITEKNFTADELAAMQKAVDAAAARTGQTQKGSVQYVDYPRGEQIGPDFKPVGQTLGRFTYEKQPDGTTVIRDRYDFYNEGRAKNIESYEKMGGGEKALTVAGRALKNLFTGNIPGIPQELGDAYIGREGRDVTIQLPPVRRAGGGDAEPTPEEIAAASRPATFNPQIARQGEAARRLAAMRDVNTLPDPRTYAAVSGFLGTPPDQQGFSVMHPDIQGIKKAGDVGFGAGTAAQVAPVVGGAAKMLGKLTGSALNERMLAGQSLTPGFNTPAPINFAVKPRGGHFEVTGKTYGAPEDFSKPVDSVENYINSHLAITNDHPLNEWLRGKLGPYMRRDMGTEMDQFVKAADEGKKLHFVSKPITEGYTGPHIPGWLRNVRKGEGLPEEGFAKTPYGQKVEMITDRAVEPIPLEDAYPTTIPPGIQKFVETDPTMRMYGLNPTVIEGEMQFATLRDKMMQMRQMSPEYSEYGQPAIKIPERYMFTDASLQGLTPAQASERVAQFDVWKQEAKQRMASRAAFKDPKIDRTPAEDGAVWINPPDLEQYPELRKLIQDVGCDGRWCTKEANFALNYGSGNNRLTVLMDKNARPKAQMTITTVAPDPDDFLLSMDDAEAMAFKAAHPDVAAYDARAIRNTPEYQAWARNNANQMAITEIKGFDNQEELLDAPYLKQIQDRVKQLDAQFDLQSVDNMDGIGLTEISRNSPYDMLKHFSLSTMTRNAYGDSVGTRLLLKDKFGSEREGLQAILDEAIKMNGGSKYFSGNEDEISDLFHRATGNILGPEGRATGGLIERRSDDSRKYL